MLRFFLILMLVSASTFILPPVANGQIAQGGQPISASRALPAPAGVRMPEVDVEPLAAQDLINDHDKSIPYRFGKNHAVDLHLDNAGTWTALDDGTRVWRLGIECPNALSVNFEFHDFRPAPGAKVFVIDAWGNYIGSFTSANDHGEHVLGVQALKGSRITIEYVVPATGPVGHLKVGQVTHGYRDIFQYARGLGDSGSCNNNVICAEADPWRDQIRSVAMITVSGNGICTGTLINNCAQNGTPYFLTANHCLGGNVSTWVFRFNWESSVCGQNLNGPTNQTVSGCTMLASSAGTDVALLQLNSTPPASYNVYYSGWDRSGSFPTAQTAIHHPRGDIKKISFDNNAAGQASYGGASCWRIFNWEDGTTEPGSSGSGLWDQNKRLIGQLYGGDATCSNNVNDYYGRLDLSYSLLQTWLGSCGNTLNGYDPNAPSVQRDVQLISIQNGNGLFCASTMSPSIVVRNGGTQTLTSFQIGWAVGGGGTGSQPWTGSLATGNSITIPLGTIALQPGLNTFSVTLSDPNNSTDQAPANNTASTSPAYGNNSVTLQINADRYGAETTWEVRSGSTVLASGGPYTTVAANGSYPQPPVVLCLPDGCYELVVSDSYGDGMCCAYGNGSFTLTGPGGTTLASGGSFTTTSVNGFCLESAVQLNAQVFLEGPYGAGPQMSDALRSGGFIPATEPYTALGYTHVGGGGETAAPSVLNVTGNNAIVDWVFLELRSGAPNYTVVATRSALLQRDGDVVDLNGSSPVSFNVGSGNFHVIVRHRNHLGIMTAAAAALSAAPVTVNFKVFGTATYGTNARRNVSGTQVMWAGDCNSDGTLRYTGTNNDRDLILTTIGGSVPTSTLSGYHTEDVNMDGAVKYTGTANDRDPILQNIGGSVPTSTLVEQLP